MASANPNAPMTLEQAAEYLQVSYRTAWRYATSGKLKANRLGPKLWRTTQAACDELRGQGPEVVIAEAPELLPEHVEALKNLERRGVFKKGVPQGWQPSKTRVRS